MTIQRKSEPESSEESSSSTSSSLHYLATNKPRLLPTPSELVELLSRRVIGQLEAKRVLAVAVYQHFLACAKSDLHGGRVESENHVLLVGPTGSGKSLLLKTLGETLRLPTIYIPCTAITPDGYKGKNFAQHLEDVSDILAEGGKTAPGIVVWDEVDKLSLVNQGDSETSDNSGVYRRMIQTEFLTYLDGTKRAGCEMNPSRILNIGIGAFVGLDKIRSMAGKPAIGFHGTPHDHAPALAAIKPEHLIRYGLIPEFVGRFSRIAYLEQLDHASLRRILMEAEGNVLERRTDFYAIHGIKLEFSDEAIDELVSRALQHGTGARALRHEVDRVLRQVEHRMPDMARIGVDSLVIERAAVIGDSPIIERMGGCNDLSNLLQIRRHAVGGKTENTKEADSDRPCIL